MYVCICRAVTDRQIREAALGGALTLQDLQRELGIAQDCGRCAPCARNCLDAANAIHKCKGTATQGAPHAH